MGLIGFFKTVWSDSSTSSIDVNNHVSYLTGAKKSQVVSGQGLTATTAK